jgi:hypothetical protein
LIKKGLAFLLNAGPCVVQSFIHRGGSMAWTFTYRKEERAAYTRFDGSADNPAEGQNQYWCLVLGPHWCSLDLWPLWPETYGLFEHFSRSLGPPTSGPHHQPVAADLMDSFDEGPILATVWSFAPEERGSVLARVEALIEGG